MSPGKAVESATAQVRPQGPALPQLTGFLLRRAYVKAAGHAQACIGTDTHVREAAILAILDERGALSQRVLADLTHLNRTTMVKLVDSLERRGWVLRERNPDDRRSYALRLTNEGKKALARLRLELDEGERLFTDGLTARQRPRLKRLLLDLLADEDWLRVASFDKHAGFLVAQAHRMVRGWAREALDSLELDPRDYGVLSTIARDQPCSQNHLAQVLGVTPPAALSFVEELERAGLVRRERNVDDRRSYDLTLTPAGARKWSRAQEAARRVQARVVDRLGEHDDAELRSLLSRLISP
jgi:DNA-binding MarR family transcriptional regulator